MEKLIDFVCYATILVCGTILTLRVVDHYFPSVLDQHRHQYQYKHKPIRTNVLKQHQVKSDFVTKISRRYTSVPRHLIKQVVEYSKEYERPDFPRQQDILAVIAIESSFRPHAVSNLKRDPAIGLTQIRPNAWRHKIKRHELNSIENQIKYGADILAHNYRRLGDKDMALHAYNMGLTATLKGARNPTYVHKFKHEKRILDSI